MSKAAGWIIYDDKKPEKLHFTMWSYKDFRRYCKQKGARSGWRYVEDCDKYLMVYPYNRNDGGEE